MESCCGGVEGGPIVPTKNSIYGGLGGTLGRGEWSSVLLVNIVSQIGTDMARNGTRLSRLWAQASAYGTSVQHSRPIYNKGFQRRAKRAGNAQE